MVWVFSSLSLPEELLSVTCTGRQPAARIHSGACGSARSVDRIYQACAWSWLRLFGGGVRLCGSGGAGCRSTTLAGRRRSCGEVAVARGQQGGCGVNATQRGIGGRVQRSIGASWRVGSSYMSRRHEAARVLSGHISSWIRHRIDLLWLCLLSTTAP